MTDRDQATLPDEDQQSDQADEVPAEPEELLANVSEEEQSAASAEEAVADPESEAVPGQREPEPLQWAATAAYVLGVLSSEDAAAAGDEIARSPALQDG